MCVCVYGVRACICLCMRACACMHARACVRACVMKDWHNKKSITN